MLRRIDAVSRVVYDPSGKTTGQFYPPDATHWRGKLIRKSQRRDRADFAPISLLESTGQKSHFPPDEREAENHTTGSSGN
jgi:hypothetical protein